MRRSEHADATVLGEATLQADALVICQACGARVESMRSWAVLKLPPGICARWEPDDLWYEMNPCGCEVGSFTWRTKVLEADARDLTGRQLPAPRRELTRRPE